MRSLQNHLCNFLFLCFSASGIYIYTHISIHANTNLFKVNQLHQLDYINWNWMQIFATVSQIESAGIWKTRRSTKFCITIFFWNNNAPTQNFIRTSRAHEAPPLLVRGDAEITLHTTSIRSRWENLLCNQWK